MGQVSGTKKYRRPDGSTYTQYGGPKSAQDVEVKDDAPAAAPTPKPGGDTSTRSSGASTVDRYDRAKRDRADEAAAGAEATSKVAPWLLEKPKEQEGGLGGAAKRAKARLKGVDATELGDAMAKDAEKKKP